MTDKEAILEKLKDSSLSIEQIAKHFGVSLRTFYRRMETLGIEHDRKRGRKTGTLKPLSNVN